jgi:hypothetical protein
MRVHITSIIRKSNQRLWSNILPRGHIIDEPDALSRTCLSFPDLFADRESRRRLAHPYMTRSWPNLAWNLLRLAWCWPAPPSHALDQSLCSHRASDRLTKRRRPDEWTIFQQPRFGRWFFTINRSCWPSPLLLTGTFFRFLRWLAEFFSIWNLYHATSLAECIFSFCALTLIVSLKKSRSL